MSDIVWKKESCRAEILTVAAGRSLGGVLQRMVAESAEWVVVVRTKIETREVFYYALHRSELQRLVNDFPERTAWPIELVMDMHEWTASGSSRSQRPITAGGRGPIGERIVNFDPSGRVIAIGEKKAETGQPARAEPTATRLSPAKPADTNMESFGLGPTRGPHARDIWRSPESMESAAAGIREEVEAEKANAPAQESVAPPGQPAEIQVTLSAETKAEIQVGSKELVDFRVELSAEAEPLAEYQATTAKPDAKIVVMLSAENDAIELIKGSERRIDPPKPGQPRYDYFLVKGTRPGLCRVAVTFRQGGSVLGVIGLAVEVVDTCAKSLPARGSSIAEARDLADDDKLALLIEQRSEGGQIFYEYTLHSEALGFQYRKLRSKPLLDRGGGLAASTTRFVEHIYEKMTEDLKSREDLKQLARETRALGASLCQELFDPAVAQLLWPRRDKIKLIQIVSWEPYIPWELVRLRDPVSGEIDERFLAEYEMVRTLSDEPPARNLSMTSLSYFCAKYPGGSEPEIGADLDLTVFQKYGTSVKTIQETRDAFYDAIADGDFDVLHVSCHAQSEHQSIEKGSLILGDEIAPGLAHPRLIEVDTDTVKAEAKRWKRQPLVFLNACETGRVGAVLTDWGGWPNVFLRAGAGAFVGTSWAVRDKPASAFAKAFYSALLERKTLAEAASEARNAAKALGDSSWLAFKVYGHPLARHSRA